MLIHLNYKDVKRQSYQLYGQNRTTAFAAMDLVMLIRTLSMSGPYVVNAQQQNALQQNTKQTGTFNYTQTDESGNPASIKTLVIGL